MSIRKKLLLIISAATLVSIIVIASTVFSVQATNKSMAEEQQANLITTHISDLLLLSHEHLIKPSPRTLQQWNIRYTRLLHELRSLESDNASEKKLVNELLSRLEKYKGLIDKVRILNTTNNDLANTIRQQRLYDAVAGRLLVEARQIEGLSIELNNFKHEKLHDFQTHNNQLLTAFILMLALLSIFIAYLILRSIARPISILKKETEFIRQGNFEHPIDISGSDEIADLAHSFDVMRESLLETMVSKNQLEFYVNERTAELKEARDQAEQANLAKSQFLSSMSHELRTPLNAILGFGQLLQIRDSEISHEQIQEYINEIMGAGDHLLELITEVLDLSRIEAGHLDIRTEPIPLTPMVSECMSQINASLARKYNITLMNKIDDCDLVVQADPLRFKQVLINLLSNAVKYNREGGSVTINTEQAGEDRIGIVVSDTGKGIAAADMDKLFDPFERLSYKNGNIEGTGIGLTVTKQLVDAMEGTISVESRVDQGSTFRVELPLAKSERHEAKTASETLASQHVATDKKHKILYIEDNPVNTRVIADALHRRGGIDVLTSPTAELGLTMAREKLPDIILMDINLPGIGGVEALQMLRNEEATSRIPVIAVTAHAMESDVQFAHEAGFDDYLTKPINIKKLYAAIDKQVAA